MTVDERARAVLAEAMMSGSVVDRLAVSGLAGMSRSVTPPTAIRAMHAYAAERTREMEAENARLREVLAPFVDIGPQRGAWGLITKTLDDLAPLTVTVTKAQMRAAFDAYRTALTGQGEGG